MAKILYLIKIKIVIFILLLSNSSKSQTASTVSHLVFGEVVAGLSKEIFHTSSGAAKFRTKDNPSKTLLITFTLPANLISGPNSIPITFSSAYSGYSDTDNPATATSFNPFQTISFFTAPTDKTCFIWLGGKVTVSGSTLPGTYTGTIIMTVVRQ